MVTLDSLYLSSFLFWYDSSWKPNWLRFVCFIFGSMFLDSTDAAGVLPRPFHKRLKATLLDIFMWYLLGYFQGPLWSCMVWKLYSVSVYYFLPHSVFSLGQTCKGIIGLCLFEDVICMIWQEFLLSFNKMSRKEIFLHLFFVLMKNTTIHIWFQVNLFYWTKPSLNASIQREKCKNNLPDLFVLESYSWTEVL